MNVKLVTLLLVSLFIALLSACQNSPAASNQASNQTTSGETPTEAYKRLYAAVKSKNTEDIKKFMSKTTQEFAAAMADMRKQPIEEMYKNGFSETTMGNQLPPMRDERIKEDFAALEVQNPSGVWEDLPFVKEEGVWKLAIGDLFKGSYKSPGAPASRANAQTQMPPVAPAANAANSNTPPAILNPGGSDQPKVNATPKSNSNSKENSTPKSVESSNVNSSKPNDKE